MESVSIEVALLFTAIVIKAMYFSTEAREIGQRRYHTAAIEYLPLHALYH